MSTAPKGHLILLRITVGINIKVLAVTGQYHRDYGGFVTFAMNSQVPLQLYPQAWMEIPGLARVDIVDGLDD
jgi:hypothetical protein